MLEKLTWKYTAVTSAKAKQRNLSKTLKSITVKIMKNKRKHDTNSSNLNFEIVSVIFLWHINNSFDISLNFIFLETKFWYSMQQNLKCINKSIASKKNYNLSSGATVFFTWEWSEAFHYQANKCQSKYFSTNVRSIETETLDSRQRLYSNKICIVSIRFGNINSIIIIIQVHIFKIFGLYERK